MKTIRERERRRLALGAGFLVLVLGLACGCALFNLPPTASFEVSDAPRPGVAVSFTNTSTDPNGFEDLTQFVWDLGDGTIADTFNVSHTYDEAGTYTVKLTVYDSAGDASTSTRDIDVRSRVFGMPEEFAVGRTVVSESTGQVIPDYGAYDYTPADGTWQVVYFAGFGYGGGFVMYPKDIIFWVRVPFADELSQAVELSLYWELQRADGEIVKAYRDPNTYALGDLSRTAGIDAIMSYWQNMAYRNATLPEGDYKVRLTLTDELSKEEFVWDFPFTVNVVLVSTP